MSYNLESTVTHNTSEDKLQAISKLTFPCTLKQLEYYLGLTSWLRQYISYYAKRAAALQARKMKLYQILRAKGISTGPKRAREASRLYLENPTPEEIESFRSLQDAFKNFKMLVHFNPEKRLYVDIDSSGKGIGAMIYHSETDPPTQKSVSPILFLSRLLKPAETRYWPTELEIAGLCWVIAKIRHLIESSKHRTIIYTDHQSLIQIATQTSRTTTSLVRLNPRHLRSSEYLSRFRLEVRHKPGQLNIVPDALSRLEINNSNINNQTSYTKLPANQTEVLVYPVMTLHIGQSWINKLKQAYILDSRTSKLIEQLQENQILEGNAAILPFEYVGITKKLHNTLHT